MFTVIVKGLIVKDQQALTLRRHEKQAYGAGFWELVGGKLKDGETIEEGLEREIFEETGIKTSLTRLLYATSNYSSSLGSVLILVYLMTPHSLEVTLSHEHMDYRWAKLPELRRLIAPQILEDLDRYGALDIDELK